MAALDRKRQRGSRLQAILGLLHAAPSAVTVAAAAAFMVLLGGRVPPLDRLGLVVLMVALQQAAISLHNDWCDRELDTQSKPWRAIPAGIVSTGAVHLAAWLCAGLSTLVSAIVGPPEVVLDLIALIAGFGYNARLKASPLSWLPFAVAFPLLPLFGAAALNRWPRYWWSLFAIGLPLVLAIHLADSLPDVPADAAAGVRGLAHRLGQRRARRVSVAALGLALVLVSTGSTLLEHGIGSAFAALALVALGAAILRPGTHRVAVTFGAAMCGLGWMAVLTRR